MTEDPFLETSYGLPLKAFCKTIEADVLSQLVDTPIKQALKS